MDRRKIAAFIAIMVAAVIGLYSFAWAAPMEPQVDDWDPFAEVEETGGMMGGPGRVAQVFIDQNLFFGSNLQASNMGGGVTPTGMPTGMPTSFPTGMPTGFPTGMPTGMPTGFPTGMPTSWPSGMPSGFPTKWPGASAMAGEMPPGFPTDMPTGMPTDMPPGGGSSSSGRCNSIDVAPCDTATSVYAIFVLPLCTAQRSKDCVESLYVRKGGVLEEAQSAGEWIGQDSYTFPAIDTSTGKTPPSGNLPLFTMPSAPHSGGDLYAASVAVEMYLMKQGSEWVAQVGDLGAQIIPVKKVPFDSSLTACIDVGTMSTDRNTCLNTTYRLPNEVMGIRANVSATFGSWIFGRVVEPKIAIKPDGDSISLDVEGLPAVVPNLTAILPSDEVTSDMFFGTAPKEGPLVTSFKAGQQDSLRRWSLWNYASGSRADTLKRLWVYHSSKAEFSGLGQCVKAGEVAGWISTNAMVYEATPPVFNKDTGALDFKIGGPALQPDGTLPVSADYELFLRTDVAGCIWPGQKVAQVATVSVIDGAGGEEVTTTSVGEQDGWTKFIARNVLFPKAASPKARASAANPTVRIVVPKAPPAVGFASCTVMRKTYKDGVSATGAVNTVTVKGKKVTRPALGKPLVSDAIYTANAKLDTDKDRLVCEREPKVK